MTRWFAADIEMRFGNQDWIFGKQAVSNALITYMDSIEAISHRMRSAVTDGTVTFTSAEVTYTFPGGETVSVPAATEFVADRSSIRKLMAYIDLSPVYEKQRGHADVR